MCSLRDRCDDPNAARLRPFLLFHFDVARGTCGLARRASAQVETATFEGLVAA